MDGWIDSQRLVGGGPQDDDDDDDACVVGVLCVLPSFCAAVFTSPMMSFCLRFVPCSSPLHHKQSMTTAAE